MDPVGALNVYQELGVAGLFICMYLTTVWFLIRLLTKDKDRILASVDKERERTAKIAVIVEKNSAGNERMVEIMQELKKAVERDVRLQSQFITYLKTKDEFERGEGR